MPPVPRNVKAPKAKRVDGKSPRGLQRQRQLTPTMEPTVWALRHRHHHSNNRTRTRKQRNQRNQRNIDCVITGIGLLHVAGGQQLHRHQEQQLLRHRKVSKIPLKYGVRAKSAAQGMRKQG